VHGGIRIEINLLDEVTTGVAPSISHGVRDASGTLHFVGGQQRATTTASRTDDRGKADI
jgi:hypothetical protein